MNYQESCWEFFTNLPKIPYSKNTIEIRDKIEKNICQLMIQKFYEQSISANDIDNRGAESFISTAFWIDPEIMNICKSNGYGEIIYFKNLFNATFQYCLGQMKEKNISTFHHIEVKIDIDHSLKQFIISTKVFYIL